MKNFKYPFMILLGASSYGVLASVVKLGLNDGHTSFQLIATQYILGLLIISLAQPFIMKTLVNKTDKKKLISTGLVMSFTGISYTIAIDLLSPALAIVLLFQFTWIGTIYESIATKKWPSLKQVLSIIILLGGTLLASNILVEGLENLNVVGLIFGILSAISYVTFMVLSNRVATHVPGLQRTFYFSIGAVISIVIIGMKDFVTSPIELGSLSLYGIVLAIFGAVLPPILFTIASPKVKVSMSNIVGAAELPVAIIAAYFLLNQGISSTQLVGIVLILIGVIIPQINTKKASN